MEALIAPKEGAILGVNGKFVSLLCECAMWIGPADRHKRRGNFWGEYGSALVTNGEFL